ncbi:MAG: formylglycine-generating enzyme family protein [Nitrospirae bacterium]|nr:formylglycine-generating enzyme family protein [Fimbriimonadaceae bacterium]
MEELQGLSFFKQHLATTVKWTKYFESQSDLDAPVTGVSWREAHLYCHLRGGRLPTSEELEADELPEMLAGADVAQEADGYLEWTSTPLWNVPTAARWARRAEYVVFDPSDRGKDVPWRDGNAGFAAQLECEDGELVEPTFERISFRVSFGGW